MQTETSKNLRTSTRNSNNVIAHDLCQSKVFKENLVYFLDYDSFFLYTDNKYFKKLSIREMRKTVLRWCETQYQYQGFTGSQMDDIISIIKLKIERENNKEDTHLIAFNDCLYNTRDHSTLEFSTKNLCAWSLPYNLAELKNATPVFTSFLESSLVEASSHTTPDFELINLVQEMMGFLLLDSNYATGAFFLYGQGSNGKSVLTSLIERIFGDDYVSSMSLSDFSKPFAIGDIINKRVNISNEEDERNISGKMFKVLITGESLRGEHKFGSGYKMKPTAKFLFSTNKLPTFDGLDYGLKRRIFLIPFFRKFLPHEQDKHLLEKLIPEIPGIIGWALEGAKRLAENNYVFSQSKASADVFAEFEEEMSAAIMFFNENYVVDSDSRVSRQGIYDHYLAWTSDNGKKGVFSKRRFNKELLDNIKGLDDLFGKSNNMSYRAFNCRLSNRDEREAMQAQDGR